MAMIRLPNDFKEFLRLLNSNEVHYLLVGGYAVGYHGFPRATVDLDVWIAQDPANIDRVANALREFGFPVSPTDRNALTKARQVLRMGVPPLRIEVLAGVSGVEFSECYARRKIVNLDGVDVSLIAIDDLKRNKLAAGRSKDLNDLEHLPEP